MNWLYYLAEANIYLSVFYLAYCLFLNKETHYQLNRAYLIFSCVISFILPVLQIGALKHVEPVAVNMAIYTEPAEAITPAVSVQTSPAIAAPVVIEHQFTLQDGLWYAYITGAALLFITLLIKLYTLFKLARNAQRVARDKHKVIYLPDTDVAFSFFNYLFIGTNAKGANTMIRHELVHIRQKHSADIIFMEVLKIVNWFNPFIYLLQNSLKIVHEYIADEKTVAYETDALTYSSFLVNNAYGAGGSSITHSFFNYNLLKKRIIMLNQQRSGSLARLKYLMAVPICVALLCASTLAFSKTYGWVDVMPAPKNVESALSEKPDTIPKRAYISEFGQYLMFNTKYPADARNNNITGHVIVTFTVADYKLKNINIIKKMGHGVDEEVMRSLKNCPKPVNLSPGKYALPFYFNIMGISYHAHSVDKDGNINEYKGIADGFTFLNDVVITDDNYKLPPPMIIKDGYDGLYHYLIKNINYNPTKNDKGGEVIIGFTVNSNHHISSVKTIKSADSKLGDLATDAFKTFNGTIYGGHGDRFIVVYFYTTDYSVFKSINTITMNPGCIGDMVITNEKYKPNVTSKGYEYDERRWSGADNKVYFSNVTIYEKNGDAKSFSIGSGNAAEVKLLKEKYGYSFPKGVIAAPPKTKPKVTEKKFPQSAGKPYGNGVKNLSLSPASQQSNHVSPPSMAGLPPSHKKTSAPSSLSANQKQDADTTDNLAMQLKMVEWMRKMATSQNVDNIVLGKSTEIHKHYLDVDKQFLRDPQLVFIHVDDLKPKNARPGDADYIPDYYANLTNLNTNPPRTNHVYLINGKIYTRNELEKRSAAISTKKDIKTLFSAEYMIRRSPDNPDDIKKYGEAAKNGMIEFVNVTNSKL